MFQDKKEYWTQLAFSMRLIKNGKKPNLVDLTKDLDEERYFFRLAWVFKEEDPELYENMILEALQKARNNEDIVTAAMYIESFINQSIYGAFIYDLASGEGD